MKVFWQDYCPLKHNNFAVTGTDTDPEGDVIEHVTCQTCGFTWDREQHIPQVL